VTSSEELPQCPGRANQKLWKMRANSPYSDPIIEIYRAVGTCLSLVSYPLSRRAAYVPTQAPFYKTHPGDQLLSF
jgi:hypothetical protein